MKCNSMSASRYKCYGYCEFMYYLTYELGIQQKKKWATENGSFCHEIYEELANAVKEGRKPKIKRLWVRELVEAYRNERTIENKFGAEEKIPPLWTLSPKALEREKRCDKCPYFSAGKCWVTGKKIEDFEGCPRDEFDMSVWLIERVLEDKGRLNPQNKKIIGVEDKFDLEIKINDEHTIKMRGFLDVVSELDDETIEIEDYKTGKFTQNYRSCLEDPQFLIYYMAGRQMYPRYKWIFITPHWLQRKSGASPTLAFGPDDEARVRQMLIDRYLEIVHNDFPQRRCDRSNGFVNFDWLCKAFCDPKTCQVEWENFIADGATVDE